MSASEIKQIEDALDAYLTAILEHERRIAGEQPPRPLRVVTLAELMVELDDDLAWFDDDPIGGEHRNAIRLLGERLYQITGDTVAMADVAERVADRDPKNWGHRIDIIDKRWDGIGGWYA